jgi:signal transduction histidine kinase
MFFRGTQGKDGAGLGLYIVHEAVEKLNGTVNINSRLHKGTTFVIDIPNASTNQKTKEYMKVSQPK